MKRLAALILGLAATAATAADASWWGRFHDPALDRLEQDALAANGDLQAAVARVTEAQARAGSAGAGRYPTLTAPLSATRRRTTNTGPVESSRLAGAGFPGFPPGASFSAQALSSTYDDFQVPLEAAYEVDVFGRIRHAYAQGKAEARATLAEREAVRLSLTAQVASGYFALRAADSAVAVVREALGVRQDAVTIQERRTQAGAASDVDLLRARVELENARAALADALQQRTELENSLAVLCGQTPGEFHLAPEPLGQAGIPSGPADIAPQLVSRRPDLIEAEERLAAAAEGAKAALARLYPSVRLRADYGYESAQSNRLLENQSREWLVGGAIDIPIFDGGKDRSDLKAARAQVEEALASYRQAQASARREAEDASSALRRSAEEEQDRRQAEEDARKVLRAVQGAYERGGLGYFEVIDAERSLFDAELSRVQALNRGYAAAVGLERATGGASDFGRPASP